MTKIPVTKVPARLSFSLLLFSLSLAGASSAWGDPALTQYGLPAPIRNAICQTMLVSEGAPARTSVTYVGIKQIAAYYVDLQRVREELKAMTGGEHRLDLGRAALAANLGPVLMPTIVGALALAGTPGAYLIPLALGVPAIAYDAYSANRFRFRRDVRAEHFDQRASEIILAGHSRWPTAWAHHSATYRLPAGLIRAIRAGDAAAVAEFVRDVQKKQLSPRRDLARWGLARAKGGRDAARAVRADVRPGFVTIDRSIDHDEVAGQPRLTVEVQTSEDSAIRAL